MNKQKLLILSMNRRNTFFTHIIEVEKPITEDLIKEIEEKLNERICSFSKFDEDDDVKHHKAETEEQKAFDRLFF